MKVFPHDARYAALVTLLRTIRTEKKRTQTDIATHLGKPQSFVSKYESGERRLDPVELYLICDALGMSFTAFAKRYEKTLASQGLSQQQS